MMNIDPASFLLGAFTGAMIGRNEERDPGA